MAKDIDRRNFLKALGGGVVASSALLTACSGKNRRGGSSQEPAGVMTMRVNHNTGDKVSLLGYGMMRLPSQGRTIDQDMVNRLVDYAIEHGVNYFDTSPAYSQGLSERATGIALHRHPRDKYFVATKLSNFSAATQTREASIEMFETSLKELQVDYIDYLLLHSIGGGNDAIAEFNQRFMNNGILDWLVEQKQLGRIRNLGFSYHGDIAVFDMLLKWMDEGRYHWDFVQVELNYLDWEWANEINRNNTDASYLYEELTKRNIPAVIMEPLLGGRLASVPEKVVQQMKQMRPEDSIASWAFRFAGSYENSLTVLSGMTYMEHLQENVKTFSPLDPLTEKEKKFLLTIAEDIYNLKDIPCNECNYCMPCPYGIDIPGIFSHYNKMNHEVNMPDKKQSPSYRKQRRAFLIGYDRSVPRLRQANHCIGCNQCSPHCPQRINIPREMRRIDTLVENLKRDGKVEDTTI